MWPLVFMAAFLAEPGFMLGLPGLLSHSSHSQFTSYLSTYPRTLSLLFFQLIALNLSCLRLLFGTVSSLPIIKSYEVFQKLTTSAESHSSWWVTSRLCCIWVQPLLLYESKIHFNHQMKIYSNPHRQKKRTLLLLYLLPLSRSPLTV